jgi:phage tail-like protein
VTTSSYLQFLPPVLWESPEARASLGSFLCIFEKILTGIDDGQPIPLEGRQYASVEAQIARVFRLFDPSLAPVEFLDELASWLALEFPRIGETHVWDEFQRRKLTGGILQVYRRRGLRDGINRYLDLYTVAETRPRIAVDDGSRVLIAEPAPGRLAEIEALVTQEPVITRPAAAPARAEGLVRPLAIAASEADGSLFVTDQGTPSNVSTPIKAGVWRIPPANAAPVRLGEPGLTLDFPAAIVFHRRSGNLYVLDTTGLLELTPPFIASTKKDVGVRGPVAMCVLPDDRLLILDRGPQFQSGSPAVPALVEVQLQPFTVRRTALSGVVEPMSLCITPAGVVIVGDGREQAIQEDSGGRPLPLPPADLVIVDRASGTARRVLGDSRPGLAAPVGLVAEDDQHILVLDLGLKPYFPRLDENLPAYSRHIAEPAALYRVTLEDDAAHQTPAVEIASTVGNLVFPTGMTLSRGKLFISDKGEYSDPAFAGDRLRVWRTDPFQFGVAVHFAESRKPSKEDRKRILHDIQDIVDRERPAHTHWTMVFSSGE